VDLTVTSPPYDNLRTYNGNIEQWSFEKFQEVSKELYRVTADGGIVVWVVADATIRGSETGTSFKQALYFKECGFNLHDTMIWHKPQSGSVGSMKRYESVFEYMFVFSKGAPANTNIICDKPNKRAGEIQYGSIRQADGSVRKTTQYGKRPINQFGRRHNVWDVSPEMSASKRCHPSQFPEKLAHDHIISWSNAGDIVLDCFMGSGSTGVACINTGRNFIGIELDEGYFNIAQKRIEAAQAAK
jgi:DNA modification methylase